MDFFKRHTCEIDVPAISAASRDAFAHLDDPSACVEGVLYLPTCATDFSVRYHKPAYYDDLLTIKTSIAEIPKVRIRFLYETYNEKGDLLNEGETTLVFINTKTGKPCEAPENFIEKIKGYY